MKKLGLDLSAGLATAALLLASASGVQAGEVNIVPVLAISGAWSDNVFFEGGDQKSDTFLLVNPGVSLDYGSKSAVVSLAYQAGIQRYSEFSNRDNTLQRLDGSLGFNIGSGFSIDIVDNFQWADDPLAFDASGDRIQRDSYVYNHISPGFSYRFGSRDVMIAAKYDRVDVDYDNLTDSEQNGFNVKLGGRLGSKSAMTFQWVEFRREFTEESQFIEDYDGRRIGVTVDRQLTPRFSMRGFGGYEERKFDNQGDPSNDFDSGVFAVDVVGDIPDVISITASASRNLNDLAVRGVYIVDRFGFELRRSWAERLRTRFNLFYQKMENEQLNEQANFTGFKVDGEYLIAKFLNLFLGYEYLDRQSDSGGIDAYEENRVNFGLTVSYGL